MVKAISSATEFSNISPVANTDSGESYYTNTAYKGVEGQKIREATCQQYGAKIRTTSEPMYFPPYVKAEDFIGAINYSEIKDPRSPKECNKDYGFWWLGKFGKSITARQQMCYQRQYFRFGPFNFSAVFGFIAILGWVGFIMNLIILVPYLIWDFFDVKYNWSLLGQDAIAALEIMAVLFCCWKLFMWLAGIIPANRGTYLDRRTGMLYVPRRFKKTLQFPFAELVPSLFHLETYKLVYAHPPTRYAVTDIAGEKRMDAFLRAIFLEQFMDVTKPLPDVPYLEIYRHLDPTTAAYDKATNRNPRFWRDKTKEEIDAIVKERQEAMKGIFGGGAFSV